MKKKFELSNIPSINILTELEANIELSSIDSKVTVNTEKYIVFIETTEEFMEMEVNNITEYLKALVPNIEIKEMEVLPTHRRILILDNLDCANCAAKIERIAKRTFNHEFIVVDFATTRFIIETSDEELLIDLEHKVDEITKMVDNNIFVHYKTSASEMPHKHDAEKKVNKILFIVGAIIFIIALALHYIVFRSLFRDIGFDPNDLSNFSIPGHLPLVILYGIAYLCLGGDVLFGAIRNIKSGRFFDEKFLMSLATIMAFIIGSFTEAVSVMIFYKIGELLQEHAVNSSRRSISALMDIKPVSATMIVNNTEMIVDPLEIVQGDIIIVKPGERIPLDGVIVEGEAALDTSALTGESKFYEVKAKDKVISGSINTNGYLKIKVTKIYEDSTVAKILDMVSNASSKKAKTENFISKFAKYYTPIVCGFAVLIILLNLLFFEKSADWHTHFHDSIYPAMIFLVVSCPCALVLSVPLGFFGGIGGASKKGILIKGSNHLESLSDVGMVVFDKTGTLTKGSFTITKMQTKLTTEEELLRYAAYCEAGSIHPIAKSIIEKYGREKIDFDKITYMASPSKKGTIISFENSVLAAGNMDFMKEIKVKAPLSKELGLIVYIAKDSKYIGHIVLEDTIRSESAQTIATLKKMGIKVAMVTGDNEEIASNVAMQVGIDKVYSNISAIEKVKKVRKLKKELIKKKLIYIGDGMNDAPVLSSADVGIAMGALGSDAAIEVADIVLMTDDLSKIPEAIGIARKTKRVVVENIVFALVIKLFFMLLVVLPSIIPIKLWLWEAIFADVGVSLIAIINSLRAANLSLKDVKKYIV